MQSIRVALFDDHSHIHLTVSTAIDQASDITLVAQGSNGDEAITLCEKIQPDVVLMDVVMPSLSGIEATRIIRQRLPNIKILVLSSFQDDDSVQAMIKSGANGYILKGAIATDLVDTIRATYHGNAVFSQAVSQVLLHTVERARQDFDLTAREIEVLRLMAQGLNNGEIAAQLVISRSTVKFHINNVLQKMRVETRAEAIVLAAKNHMV